MSIAEEIRRWCEEGNFPPSRGTLEAIAAKIAALEARLEQTKPQEVEEQH